MRSFYFIYGTLLLLVSVAFSYLESHSKDERVLEAKINHASKLVNKHECAKAFNLLTQINQAALSEYYSQLSKAEMKNLKRDLCYALKKQEGPIKAIRLTELDRVTDKGNTVYKVEISHSSGQSASQFIFKRQFGELILKKVDP